MHKSSNSPGRQIVRWHGPRPSPPSSAASPSPILTPSRASLGLLAKAKSWLSAQVSSLGRRQARSLAATTPRSPQSPRFPQSPQSHPSAKSPRSPIALPPMAPLSPASRAAPASPATPLPPSQPPALRRFDARDVPDAVRARTHRAIAEGLTEGLNETLALCHQSLVQTPADQADLSSQSFKDWNRGWRIAFQPPGGEVQELQVAPDGSAELRAPGSGRTQAVNLRPGQQPSAIARLARHLGVEPVRLLRVCRLLAQTELAAAERVIARQSALTSAFGEGAQIGLTGGEHIRVTAHFGAGDADDRVDFALDREGRDFSNLVALDSQGHDTLIPLDVTQSFLRWQARARISAAGVAQVEPASVRLDYRLVEASDERAV